MPRNGSGSYNLPANSWFPAVNGVTATSTDWNNTAQDLQAGLTQSVSSDGQTPMTGNLPMGNNKITGLAAGTAITDAANFAQTVGRLVAVRLLTTSGSYTPSPGATSGLLMMVGGSAGASGTNATTAGQVSINGGAGSGAFLMHYFSTLPIGQTYTIGSGGSAGPIGTAGGAGGSTVFGALSAGGGGASTPIGGLVPPLLVMGGLGATASGGNLLNIKGNDGGVAIALSSTQFHGGEGGDAPYFGVGGTMRANTTIGGVVGSGYGAGPSGPITGPSVGTGQVGTAGQPGAILIYEYSGV